MLKEIAEQPAALERTIAEERIKIAKLGKVLKTRDIHLIVLVARGSSDNAALFGRYLLEITTGIPVSLSAPSVHTIYNAELRLDHALVVGVSQSGEGEDINRVLENARASGAFTVGISNEPGSSMTHLVDETLLTHGGKERSVAATKTFTGQMLLFYMLAAELARKPAPFSYEAIPEFVAQALEQKAGDTRTRATLRLHGKLRCGRAGTGLCECVRVGAEVDGDLLCRSGTIFISGFPAWSTRDGRATFSGDTLRAAGSDVARSKESDRASPRIACRHTRDHERSRCGKVVHAFDRDAA